MRRTYISPEYKYLNKPGSLNMQESTSFFGSKMMDIEDTVIADSSNIVYYTSSTGEQISFNLEKNNPAIVYNTVLDKESNHIITQDKAQSQTQIDTNCRWIIDIDLKKILQNYLFAQLKSARTFEGVLNTNTIYGNVDDAVRQYIDKNLISRYGFIGIDFYVEYVELSIQGRLRFVNHFTEITSPSSTTTRIQSTSNFDNSKLTVIFNQELPTTSHVFDYYFIPKWQKV
jgi:hypothetical protein